MSSLLTLVEDIRLRKSDSIERIEGSAKEVRCKPNYYFALTFTAQKNLTKVQTTNYSAFQCLIYSLALLQLLEILPS